MQNILNLDLVRQAAKIAAKKDIRHYLNGVRIEVTEKQIHYVATCGEVCSILTMENANKMQPTAFTLSHDIIKSCGNEGFMTYEQVEVEGVKTINLKSGHVSVALKNSDLTQYPQWRRIIPAELSGTVNFAVLNGAKLKAVNDLEKWAKKRFSCAADEVQQGQGVPVNDNVSTVRFLADSTGERGFTVLSILANMKRSQLTTMPTFN